MFKVYHGGPKGYVIMGTECDGHVQVGDDGYSETKSIVDESAWTWQIWYQRIGTYVLSYCSRDGKGNWYANRDISNTLMSGSPVWDLRKAVPRSQGWLNRPNPGLKFR
jgi:hypothetical protein